MKKWYICIVLKVLKYLVMKIKYLLLTIYCILHFQVFSQTVKIIVESYSGLIDTVVVGFSTKATIGVDSILGEQNYIGSKVPGALGLIIEQRGISDFDCLLVESHTRPGTLNTYKIFFPESFDSKVNIRPYSTSYLDNGLRFFEIRSNEKISVVRIENLKSDCDTSSYYGCISFSNVYFSEGNCSEYSKSFASSPTSVPGYYSIRPSTDSTYHFSVDLKQVLITPISEALTREANLLVFPNPFSDEINLSLGDFFLETDGIVWITNVSGKTIREVQWTKGKNTLEINSENLPAGIYTVILKTQAGVTSRKLVKM